MVCVIHSGDVRPIQREDWSILIVLLLVLLIRLARATSPIRLSASGGLCRETNGAIATPMECIEDVYVVVRPVKIHDYTWL